MLLPHPISGRVADIGTGQDHDVRRARASAGSSTERRLSEPAPAPRPQTLTTADRAELARAEKQAARAAQREAEDREAETKATAAAAAAAADKAAAEAQTAELNEIKVLTAAAQAAADKSSYLRRAPISFATAAEHQTPMQPATVVASTEKFVAVLKGKEIKIFKTAELEKKLAYDGIDTGSGRFAPGNEIEIKNQKTGDAKIVLNEKRDEMKTAEKKQKENDSLGR